MYRRLLIPLLALFFLVAGCAGYDGAGEAKTGNVVQETVSETKTVLGHYPAYKILANALGARLLDLPEAVWNGMTEEERWATTREFLDQTIDRGDEIILATPPEKARPGSYYARELEYLAGKGYVPAPGGARLVKRW